MKITIYTVSDCQFSKAEKEYLQTHNLTYEEKNLEQNREWLTEMLAISNNFAGTPVTKIEKDDGQIVIVKGYNKDELDNILGLSNQNVAVVNSTVNLPNQPPTTPPSPQPSPPPPPPPQSPTPLQPPPPPPTPSTTLPSSESKPTPPQSPNTVDSSLNDILNNLQQKAQDSANQTTTSPNNNLPNIPDFNR